MADGTKIEWSDATWNIITGCSVLSPGCKRCYAMRLAGSRLQHHPSRVGLTMPAKGGPVWTGEVRFNEEWLLQPLQWSKPRKIFVCAHGDLFHEGVTVEQLDQVFGLILIAAQKRPQHIFQVLTKRSARMQNYISAFPQVRWVRAALAIAKQHGIVLDNSLETILARAHGCLPNVWLGVSVEDQPRADERLPDLVMTRAAVRWVSFEPLLGPVFIPNALASLPADAGGRIDWMVVGGESGQGWREMAVDWADALLDQSRTFDIAFFMKQMAGKHEIPARLMIREFPR